MYNAVCPYLNGRLSIHKQALFHSKTEDVPAASAKYIGYESNAQIQGANSTKTLEVGHFLCFQCLVLSRPFRSFLYVIQPRECGSFRTS